MLQNTWSDCTTVIRFEPDTIIDKFVNRSLVEYEHPVISNLSYHNLDTGVARKKINDRQRTGQICRYLLVTIRTTNLNSAFTTVIARSLVP